MNVPTFIILLVIVLLAALAVRRLVKKGSTCDCGSSDCASCPGCQPPAENGHSHGVQ